MEMIQSIHLYTAHKKQAVKERIKCMHFECEPLYSEMYMIDIKVL